MKRKRNEKIKFLPRKRGSSFTKIVTFYPDNYINDPIEDDFNENKLNHQIKSSSNKNFDETKGSLQSRQRKSKFINKRSNSEINIKVKKISIIILLVLIWIIMMKTLPQ